MGSIERSERCGLCSCADALLLLSSMNRAQMYVDDQGKAKNLPVNERATR